MKKSLRFLFICVMATCSSWSLSLFASNSSTLWNNKKVSILGDSYSSFYGTPESSNCYYFPEDYGTLPKAENIKLPQSGMWWAQVISHFGGTLSVNASVGGSPMTDCFTQDNFYERVSAKNNLLGSPDIIFVFGGMNDHWMPGNTLSTPDLFKNGIQTLFSYLKQNYGSAKVYVILNKEHTGSSWTEWGITAMQRSVLSSEAASCGFSTIDLQGYFSTENSDLNQERFPHATAQGQTKIAQRVISVIASSTGDEPLPSGHTHQMGEAKTIVSATCTNAGYTVSTCLATGCTEPPYAVTNVLTKLNHTPGEWEVKTPADVGLAGTEVRMCTFCGEIVDTREIKPLDPSTPPVVGEEWLLDGDFESYDGKFSGGHNWLNGLGAWEGWTKNAWNCPYGVWITRKGLSYWTQNEGMAGSYCCVLQVKGEDVWVRQSVKSVPAGVYRISFLYQRRNGNTSRQRFTVSFNGTQGKILVGSEVTITDDTLRTFSQDVTLPAGDWTFQIDSPSESEDVSTLFDNISMKAVSADEPQIEGHTHVMGPAETIVSATCTNEGYTVSTCVASGCTEPPYAVTNALTKLNHTPDEWEVETPAEIGLAGTEVRKCTFCNEIVDTREIKPLDPPPPPLSDENWGYSNRVTIAGVDYCVVVFTNTTSTLTWTVPSNISTLDYLVVGGGGAGGASGNSYGAGGGGAGAVMQSANLQVRGDANVEVVVGAGGASVFESGKGTNGLAGAASTLSLDGAVIATAKPGAGGAGGATNGVGGDDYACGGGAGGNYARDTDPLLSGGEGLVSKGGDGKSGAGGGGAGGDGLSSDEGGTGGTGVVVTIFDGTELRIAGGGSGTPKSRGGNPSVDGGGQGGYMDVYGGEFATAGTIWGAGGGGGRNDSPSGAGYQGVVVIRYALEGEPQTDVVIPGEEPKTYATEAAARAAAPQSITPPSDITTALSPTDLQEYVNAFVVVTRQLASDKWINEAVLSVKSQEQLQQQVDAGAAQVVSAISGETIKLTDVTPGFYYGFLFGENLSEMESQPLTLAETTEITLTIPKGTKSGFYRVVVDVKK